MTYTLRMLSEKIDKLFDCLGIKGMGQDVEEMFFTHPVGAILIMRTGEAPQAYGSWELVDSGTRIGGKVGTVYIWERIK